MTSEKQPQEKASLEDEHNEMVVPIIPIDSYQEKTPFLAGPEVRPYKIALVK